MKIILIFIAATLFSSASYIKMQQYAQKKQYYKVIQEAKYSFKDYQNPNLHLLWAKAAQKTGKLDEAMSAYERVLILEPNNQVALHSLAKIYKDTKRLGLSASAENKTNKNRLRAKVTMALGHDTNINVNASGNDLDGYYGVALGFDKISSSFTRVQVNASYIYNFEKYQNWFMQSTLDLYHQSNFSAHRFDLSVPTFEIALGYIKDEYLYYFPVSYNHINYLDQDLLNILTFTPRMRISFSNNFGARLV